MRTAARSLGMRHSRACSSRFLRPVNAAKVERLRAEARVVRAGGRLVWAEAEVLADGENVGRFAATGIRVPFDPQAYVAERGDGNGSAR